MKIEKVKKLAANLHDKTEQAIHIRNLKQVLNYGLVLKKVHRVIKFNQNAWLKPYIDMNRDLRKKAKYDFQKDFFKLMNNSVFEKTMGNARKQRYYTCHNRKKKEQFSIRTKLSYYKVFTENLLAIEIRKTEMLMNKPVYLGLSIQNSVKY